jgi:hypothetical protein
VPTCFVAVLRAQRQIISVAKDFQNLGQGFPGALVKGEDAGFELSDRLVMLVMDLGPRLHVRFAQKSGVVDGSAPRNELFKRGESRKTFNCPFICPLVRRFLIPLPLLDGRKDDVIEERGHGRSSEPKDDSEKANE